MKLRREVQWFAELMEKELRRNDHKGGWLNETDSYLLGGLIEEFRELQGAILKRKSARCIQREAADVANFAMMIADNSTRDVE